MAALKFLCPKMGDVVDTEIDLDAVPREDTRLACPHCEQPHILAGVSAWLGELQHEYE